VIALTSVATAFVPADAYWAWGPTWSSPTSGRYLYLWDSSFTAAQETTISAAAMQFDSSNTNSITSTLAGTSSLNVSGISVTSNVTSYANAPYKLSMLSPSAWGTFNPLIPAITCRSNCDEAKTISTNLGNKASVYLNGAFTFTNYFDSATDRVDLYTVVLHELGHTHGLGHPADYKLTITAAEAKSVMTVTWTLKRTLLLDDALGIESMY